MPFGSIVFRPGIKSQLTPTLNVGGWSDCQLIRFQDGLPQKLGGWAALTQSVVQGLARSLHPWADLDNFLYLAIGTHQRLEVYSSSGLNDITPLRLTTPTTNSAVDFSTVIGLSTVTIVDVNNTVTTNIGDIINLVTAIAVDGIVIPAGYYEVTAVNSLTSYVVDIGTSATSTVNNAGATASYATTNLLSTVSVTLNNHGLSPGNLYVNHVATTVGGITFGANQQYLVQSVTSANVFVIDTGTAASSTTTGSENSGNCRINYLYASGYASSVAVTGYGSGTYGSGTWGTSTTTAGFTRIRVWSLGNWGENLLACPTDDRIFEWPPTSSFSPATVISNAPTKNGQIMVANPAQILVALASETGGVQDRQLVRWSDVSDYNQWTAASTNQAGSFRIPNGSRIVGGLQTNLQAYIWTDIDLWSMQYIGQPFVFGFQQVGTACGLISGRAATMAGSRLLWMGQKGFFELAGGGVRPLPCDVWDFVFRDLDTQQFDKVFAAPNNMFNEVSWFFPSLSGGTGECDSYVKLNIKDNIWDYGRLDRTCWTDVSIWGPPIGVDSGGGIYQHEISDNANGAAMTSYIRSGDVDLGDGVVFPFVDYLVLDGAKVTGTLDLTITAKEFPSTDLMTDGPFAITSTATDASPRLRGRQMNFYFESSDLNSFWRLGRVRYRYGVDGRR